MSATPCKVPSGCKRTTLDKSSLCHQHRPKPAPSHQSLLSRLIEDRIKYPTLDLTSHAAGASETEALDAVSHVLDVEGHSYEDVVVVLQRLDRAYLVSEWQANSARVRLMRYGSGRTIKGALRRMQYSAEVRLVA